LAFVLILTAALPGCATFAKCGFAGCPGDANITENVHELFDQHAELEPPNLIDVQTLDHVVYLYGMVSTELQRETAESVALEAGDVTRVVNSIAVSN
jgi:osmotically-inducible protein OsmY